MRMVLTVLLTLLLSSTAYATDWTDSANGCEGAWLMNDTSTDIDDACNAHTSTESGDPTYSAGGQFGDSVEFDGTGDYFTIADEADFDATTDVTVVSWFYVGSAISGSDDPLVCKGDQSYCLKLDVGNNKVEWFIYNSTWRSVQANSTISTSTWYHAAGVYDSGSTPATFLYMDGVQQTATDSNSGTLNNQSYGLTFGRNPQLGNVLTGRIDESAVFLQTMSSTDINDMMDNGLEGAAPAARRRILLTLHNADWLIKHWRVI